MGDFRCPRASLTNCLPTTGGSHAGRILLSRLGQRHARPLSVHWSAAGAFLCSMSLPVACALVKELITACPHLSSLPPLPHFFAPCLDPHAGLLSGHGRQRSCHNLPPGFSLAARLVTFVPFPSSAPPFLDASHSQSHPAPRPFDHVYIITCSRQEASTARRDPTNQVRMYGSECVCVCERARISSCALPCGQRHEVQAQLTA